MNTTPDDHQSFALTISPPIRLIGLRGYVNPNRVRYDLDANDIRSILSADKLNRHIIFPEFDNKGRIHYHGIIHLTDHDFVTWHKRTVHRLNRIIGFVDLKRLCTFKDKLKWNIYFRKEWATTHKILKLQVDDPPIMKIKNLETRYDRRRLKMKEKIYSLAEIAASHQSKLLEHFPQ